MKKRKTSQHINNEEKVSQTQEKNQSSGTAPDVTKVMELADKDFTKEQLQTRVPTRNEFHPELVCQPNLVC